ncbi:SymE family type I addiction module toxin [Pantoea hericii]|uniref:SymE family type I addiction module toxin n=1 Tax=Pantoea hericii TaxID=1815628 RepID=UPI0038F64D66
MAGRDSTSEPAVPQARKSVVGYRPNGGRPNPLPQLTIKGRWLEQWGFVKGQPVSQSASQPVSQSASQHYRRTGPTDYPAG